MGDEDLMWRIATLAFLVALLAPLPRSGNAATLHLGSSTLSARDHDLSLSSSYSTKYQPDKHYDLVFFGISSATDVAPAPLPSTWTMMLIGLGLGFAAYRLFSVS
jgi:hypothetical protein